MNTRTLTLHKMVPEPRVPAYTALGWEQVPTTNTDLVALRREMPSENGVSEHRDLELKAPWLVQRAKIKRPLGEYAGASLMNSVRLDYMGSAEFEWGQVPQSLRVVQAQFSLYKHHKLPTIVARKDGKEFIMRVFANFDTGEELERYSKWLLDLRDNKLHMKESSGMLNYTDAGEMLPKDQLPTLFDFWWDIKNHVFFSYDKQFMNRIEEKLKVSFELLDAKTQ